MRSGTSAAALALLAAASGCGTWSNEDIAFVEALPTSQALKVALPASAGQALCAPPGPSAVWGWAKPAGDGLNALADVVLGFVDLVKSVTPTTRAADARTWGPFQDSKHPGKEVRVTMTRGPDADGTPVYTYAFEARPEGGDFEAVLDGTFRGESAAAGTGQFALHFATLRALGMDDHPESDPTGDLTIQYDKTADPRTLGLDVQTETATLEAFDYGYAGYASGKGFFHYAFINPQQQRYVVDARFDAAGAGRADVSLVLGSNLTLGYSECWDSAACVTDVKDPLAGTPSFPDGISQLCTGGVCPSGGCPPDL
jgi:hypothetical protein